MLNPQAPKRIEIIAYLDCGEVDDDSGGSWPQVVMNLTDEPVRHML